MVTYKDCTACTNVHTTKCTDLKLGGPSAHWTLAEWMIVGVGESVATQQYFSS